jgi:hypothetical protein
LIELAILDPMSEWGLPLFIADFNGAQAPAKLQVTQRNNLEKHHVRHLERVPAISNIARELFHCPVPQ